jgi:hypothetical protein
MMMDDDGSRKAIGVRPCLKNNIFFLRLLVIRLSEKLT